MKTILNIKVDKKLKEEVVKVAEDMALPLSTIINALLQKIVQERTITLVAPLRPSKRLIKAMKQVEKDLKTGKNLSPLFYDMDEMNKYLEEEIKKA